MHTNGDGLAPEDKRLAVQSAVARALTGASSEVEAGRRVLESIGATLGWRLGALWEVAPAGDVIRCVESWHAGAEAERAKPFEEASAELAFEPGMGLPGRVWAEEAPAWIRDVTQDPNFPRAAVAASCGMHGAFAFPIRSPHGIIGAVEFFTEDAAEPDDYLLDLMVTIGHQLGQQIERARAEAAVRASEARKAAMLDASLDCIVSMDHRGCVIEFNRAAEQTFGYSAAEVMGRDMAELIIPPSLRELHRNGLRRYLESGVGEVLGRRVELTGMRSDGREFPVELTITRIELEGPPTFTGFIRDISDRRKREEFDRFLAEAGALLGRSLDLDETLTSVTRLAVPAIADWCTIDLLAEDGSIRRAAAAHVDPAKAELAYELGRRWPSKLDDPGGFGKVIRTGEPELYEELPAVVIEDSLADREYRETVRSLGLRSIVIVPLQAGGGSIAGGLALVMAESGRRFSEDDVVLALELGRRCAIAIENARLYRERAEIAHTLQQSLLPPRLPAIPGVSVEARFRPAGEGVEVGGDFYDVFPIDRSTWAVTIGDVCGKGPQAAALTSLARYTVRAATMHERSPDRVLATLNEAILRDRSEDRFCSAVFALIGAEHDTLRVEVASGGHPLPLVVRRDGGVEEVGRSGLLLGLWDDARVVTESVELGPGDAMMFYTDGVTDALAPARIIDQQALAQLLGSCAGKGAAAIAERVEGTVVDTPEAEPRDDIALLVLGVEAPAVLAGERRDGFELTLENRPQAAAAARAAVGRLAGTLQPHVVDDLKVLVTELVSNGCRHAGGETLWVDVGVADWVVTISVRDGGHGFEPAEPSRDLDVESGRGLFIVDALADRWGVDSSAGTRVWAEMDLPRRR
ncbi:MAG: SpoIIE family protein phosphatase [Actinobacteria bacterium]|nr:SpoIIE family protein phosphatase [Actinomycetota bacterium]